MITMLELSFGDSKIDCSNRQDCIVPDVIENENNTMEIIIPSKFRADLDALQMYLNTTLKTGLCINLTLSELLTICPRVRRRIDAYSSLCKFLKARLGVELIITSQKTKKL